jgi:hypothetical protein
MSNEEKDFLRGGLRHYPRAARAVERFKDMIYARLEKGLARRWSSDEGYSHYDVLGEETYIEVWRPVKLKNGDEASVSVGIGWDSEESFLFVYCPEGPAWAKRPAGDGFERQRQYNVLAQSCEPITEDIDRDIDRILTDFDDALRPPPSATSVSPTRLRTRRSRSDS